MQIKIQPQDEEEATLMLASNVRHLATADVPAPKVITPPSPHPHPWLASGHSVPVLSLLQRLRFHQGWTTGNEQQCVFGVYIEGVPVLCVASDCGGPAGCLYHVGTTGVHASVCLPVTQLVRQHEPSKLLRASTCHTHRLACQPCAHVNNLDPACCWHATWSAHLISLESFIHAAVLPLLVSN